MTLSPHQQLADALDETGRLVEGIRADQWDQPTPCAQWLVRDLLRHLVTGHQIFTRALLGDSAPAPSAGVAPDPPQWTLAYRESADEMVTAFAAPGALERVVTIPFGSVPGAVALHLRLVEALVHGWDLAVATGQTLRCDEELAERELEFTRSKLADLPPEGRRFEPSQPAAEQLPALDRLAACLGRSLETPLADR